MNTLYLITGPAGVGKSTISKELANTLKKSVLIEGDDIYSQVVGSYINPWKKGNHLPVFWKNCLMLIQNYLDNNYDVVFNYIIYEDDLKIIKKQFSNFNINFTVLMVDEKTIIQRDKLRPKDCQMGRRCVVLLKELEKEFKDSQFLLDTSNLSISQTVSKILNK